MQKIETIVMLLLIGLVIVGVYIVSVLYLSPKAHSEETIVDTNNYIRYKEKVNLSDPIERGDVLAHLVAGCDPEWTGVWSCDSMIRYFIAENYNLGYDRISSTKDYGICQINQFAHRYTEMWNAESMRTGRWRDSGDQIAYCLGVRQNLWERKMHPGNRFYAYKG